MFGLFKKKHKQQVELEQNIDILPEEEKIEDEKVFALYLLFHKSFVVDKEAVIKTISEIDNSKVNIDFEYDLDGKDALLCNVKINDDLFQLVGLDAPLPEEIYNYTVNCAYGNEVELKRMRDHKYHIIAFYKGNSKDQMHIFNAYSKLAYGFLQYDLLGMANPYSWNSIIPSLIKEMVEDDEAKELISIPAMMVWRSFVKVPYNDGVWFVTKGNNLYDIYEYAYYGTIEETGEVYNLFENIFNYVYESKAEILAGHTMEMEGDIYMKFRNVYELENILNGDGIGTLVIEKISKNEINR
ncbi:DUF4261 domain-containing protein [Inconstantimicrobium mannanitabidum]|uniref:Uncharacterized protein n=1 Tax=Inconstantimicrobium mannanitabidum TaxID=1604901 RepID=A0ACB5RI59_9CLOT|nr:DUF4261 domain-containing protein [Clostridium sp. TW13]GKX68545.1 hypothetical protein rsdtw13_38030 [Clostridium sp. TW13]